MSAYEPSEPVSDVSRRRTIKLVLGFVVVLVIMIFVFFVFAGRIERHSYYQPSNQNPPAPVQPATPVGP